MAYTITRAGSVLKFLDGGGDCRTFNDPSLRLSANPAYPTANGPFLEVRQGENYLQLGLSDITSINGVTPVTLGGTLLNCLDALNAVPSGNAQVQTSATGATTVALPGQACSQVTLFNGTGTAIDVFQSGAAVSVPAGVVTTFTGLTNASQLFIRRTDTSNTQVTVSIRWQA